MATAGTDVNIEPTIGIASRRKRKKGRFIKRGYHKSERDDARRVAARTFLSGITLDSHLVLQQGGGALAEAYSEVTVVPYSPRPMSVASRQSRSFIEDSSTLAGPSATELSTPILKKLHEFQLESLHHSPLKVTGSKSLERTFDSTPSAHPYMLNKSVSLMESPMTARERRLLFLDGRTRSLTSPDITNLVVNCGYSLQPYSEALGNNRVVITAKGRLPFAMFSIVPYDKYEGKSRQEYPREGIRARTNSMSLQLELDGLELGTSTTEVSLAFLLTPVWVSQEPFQPTDSDTPSLTRKHSMKRSDAVKRSDSDNPRPLSCYHLKLADLPLPKFSGANFPWQSFRDHHSLIHVLLNYHPLCLDNYEYFVGRNTTTVTPHGYRVSIIQYARASDVKKGINDHFSEVFPHIELTLSKLRSIKREMHKIAIECNLDLTAVAYAYVYYEILVLMGKITKPIRKMVAGACLLLAAKFFTDIKRPDIRVLIEEIADVFRISTKELLLYEFPVLATLQFSLLTPNYQVETHYDRLRELDS